MDWLHVLQICMQQVLDMPRQEYAHTVAYLEDTV